MLESSKVEGGGTTAAVESMCHSTEVSLVEKGGRGVTPEDDLTLGHLELALI